jgi:hypothetical protein
VVECMIAFHNWRWVVCCGQTQSADKKNLHPCNTAMGLGFTRRSNIMHERNGYENLGTKAELVRGMLQFGLAHNIVCDTDEVPTIAKLDFERTLA